MPKKFISNQVLIDVLKQATDDEKESLTKLLDSSTKDKYSPIKLQKEICKMGGHGIVNIFRGQGTGYLDIVDEVVDELNIKGLLSYNLRVKYFEEIEHLKFSEEIAKAKGIEYAEKAEEKIILKLLELVYDKLDENKKEEFNKQINKVAKQFDSSMTQNFVGTAGLMALGNLGGFATYTFLTTSLSTISMGTLGFGTYTAATSFLSIALGPAGWAALGVASVFALGKPEYEKLIPIVAMIGAIRQRLTYEKSNKNKQINLDDKKQMNQLNIEYNNDNLLSTKEYNDYWASQIDNITLPTEDDILTMCTDSIYSQKYIWFRNKSNQRSIFYKGIYESYEKTGKKPKCAYLLNMDKEIVNNVFKHIQNNNINFLKTLELRKISFNIKNEDGQTPLIYASFENKIDFVNFLIRSNANLNELSNNYTALMYACAKDNLEIINALSKQISTINFRNEYNQCALHIAILNNNLNSVKILMENKAETTIETKEGFTPFMLACYQREKELTEYLYDKKDDINIKNKNGFTALTWACFAGEFNNWNVDIVKFLIEKGSNVDIEDKDSFTPLMWSTIRGNKKVVEILIENGADINFQNVDGYTPLIWASIRGHYNIAKLLVNKGAKTNIKTKCNKTALKFAKERKHKSIIAFFEPFEIAKYIRSSNTIDTFKFNNFKAFGNHPQTFSKKPITLIYGPNSVGKSTIINVFSYFKFLQIEQNIDVQSISKFGDEIDIGGIEQFMHKRDKNNIITLEVSIKDYNNDILEFFDDSQNLKINMIYTIDIKNLILKIQYLNNNTSLAFKEVLYTKINYEYKKKESHIHYEDEQYEGLIRLLDKSQSYNNLQYIGPLRPNPQRDSDHNFEETDEQFNSKELWALLTLDCKILDKVNQKLQNLDMNYDIENLKVYKLEDDFNSLLNIDNFTKYFKSYRERLEFVPKEIQNKEKEYITEKRERLIFKDRNKDNVEVSNRDLGSGVSQVLPILSATITHHNTTIAIEQPELHLHPKLQMELADEFIRSYKENQNEFMIETHSEHLLLRIMKRMRQTAHGTLSDESLRLTPDDVCLLYVDNDEKQTYIQELDLSEEGKLLDHFPNGFFEEGFKERFS